MSLSSGEYPTTQLSFKLCPVYNPLGWTSQKTLLLIVASIVACIAIGVNPAENTTFQPVRWHAGHCQATALLLFVSWLLPSNMSVHHNMIVLCWLLSKGVLHFYLLFCHKSPKL
jgi:hypothetical protein